MEREKTESGKSEQGNFMWARAARYSRDSMFLGFHRGSRRLDVCPGCALRRKDRALIEKCNCPFAEIVGHGASLRAEDLLL